MQNVVSFAAVPAGLASALEAKGFTELTAIQTAVLESELSGRDLRISSQTGSGKTVAIGFILAADLENLESHRPRKREAARPRVLLVAPTRELAAQLGKELSWLFRPLSADIAVLTGGNHIGGDFTALAQSPHVLVGTPGRLVDHIRRGSIDLSEVRTAVLDEADEMLDMGFREELETILGETPDVRRTHLVSATFPRKVMALAARYQRDPIRVDGTKPGLANGDILHIGLSVRSHDKTAALINVLLTGPRQKTLIFARTRADTSRLAGELVGHGFSASSLNGDMSQRERTATLDAFRSDGVHCLVATDVAARGLDIQDIARVIHYDLPENSEVYTHRSGRTGRAGKQGTTIALVPPAARRRAEDICHRANVEMRWQPVPTAEDIHQAADDRLLSNVLNTLGRNAPNPEEQGEQDSHNLQPGRDDDKRLRGLAEQLLESHDAVDVVAALLQRMDHAGPCEPRSIRPPASHGTKSSPKMHGRHGDDHGRGSAGKPRRHDGNFTQFHVTWGANHGANPSRLLAMICRRGDIRSNLIGAIRIGDFKSTVEVATHVASHFEHAARQPDTRNPKVRIRPA